MDQKSALEASRIFLKYGLKREDIDDKLIEEVTVEVGELLVKGSLWAHDALETALNFKLTIEELESFKPDAMKEVRKSVKAGRGEGALKMAAIFGIPRKYVLETVSESVNDGEISKAANVISDLELTRKEIDASIPEVIPLAIAQFGELMNSARIDEASHIFKTFRLTLEDARRQLLGGIVHLMEEGKIDGIQPNVMMALRVLEVPREECTSLAIDGVVQLLAERKQFMERGERHKADLALENAIKVTSTRAFGITTNDGEDNCRKAQRTRI